MSQQLPLEVVVLWTKGLDDAVLPVGYRFQNLGGRLTP